MNTKPPAANPSTGNLPSSNLLGQAFELLNTLLAHEKAVLEPGEATSHEDFARQKLQLLSNIDRMISQPEYKEFIQQNRSKIEKLKSDLLENQQILNFRMRAIEEISQTISIAMQENESDGTYQIKTGQRVYDQW